MTRASACSRTASRSLKTESLRTILPLHSIIARSFKFSTRMDNIEFPAACHCKNRTRAAVFTFQPDTTQQSFEAEHIREVVGTCVPTENAVSARLKLASAGS